MDITEERSIILSKYDALLHAPRSSPHLITMDIDDYKAADVLYLSFGKPRPAIGLDIGDGAILRYDPESLEPVGITITPFRDYYLPRHLPAIVVEPDGDSFHAYCPALPGLHTDGNTEDEARRNAGDAAMAYIESLLKHHEPIPVDMIVARPAHL